jgi:hypothetical protein
MKIIRTIAFAILIICLLFASTGASQKLLMVPSIEWSPPAPLSLGNDALYLQSGALKLAHDPGSFGAFELQVGGKQMAIGQNRPLIGFLQGDSVRWFAVQEAFGKKVEVWEDEGGITVSASFDDPDGGHWKIEQRFTKVAIPDAIGVETRVQVDRERSIIYLPMLTLFPGPGSFGAGKGQGLFAGLEYLADEPSSSEADILGPEANRRVPDSIKITFPLMAIQAGEHYVALTWEPQPDFSALFDSPDRIFHSGGHVMGILFPGSDGRNRKDGELLPRKGTKLAANTPLVLRATFLGGTGRSVVPAVQQYVHLHGLPSVPATMSLPEYVSLAASGSSMYRARSRISASRLPVCALSPRDGRPENGSIPSAPFRRRYLDPSPPGPPRSGNHQEMTPHQYRREPVLDVLMAKYGGLHSSTRSEIQPRFAGIVGNQLYRIHSAIGRVSARSSRAHSVPGDHPRNHNQLSREFVLDLQKFPGAGTIGPIGCACAIVEKIFPL